MRRLGQRSSGRLLLAALLLAAAQPCSWAWPAWFKRPDISSRASCNAASKGHVWHGDSIYEQLQAFLKVNGPVLQLPQAVTDITTAQTIIHLAAPDLTLVLDPLLYLKTLGKPPGIPRLIHMTMRDKHKLAPHQILSMLSWGRFNRGYVLLLYDNDDITAYMARYYPAFMPIYNQLKTPVEKSDAWRYHVLCGHGGVYADTDTICARPFDEWLNTSSSGGGGSDGSLPEPGLVVGVENRFHSQALAEEASYVHKIQITQWTMASKRSHPVVCRMGGAIKAFVENELSQGGALEEAVGHDASILLRTGPGIWSSQVHSYAAQMGASIEELQTGGQVADLVVLPQVAFGCNFRYWNLDNHESLTYHMYNNSWKVDHFKVADAKRAQRQAREKQARLRVLYPVLVVLSAACGVLGAAYAGLCWVASGGLQLGSAAASRRRRRAAANTAAAGSGTGREGVGLLNGGKAAEQDRKVS